MSDYQQIKEFDDYIKILISNLNLEDNEKRELGEEWKQHLYDHYASLRRKNIDEHEAISSVINQFGEIEMIQKEVNKSYPNSIKNHIQKEIAIAIVCIVASIIGPMILIGAHFRSYLIIAPIYALVIAHIIYHYVIKHQNFWLFSIVGFLAIYMYFLKNSPQAPGEYLTLDFYLKQLFSLRWDRLAGMSGIFELVTINMLWYVIILFQFIVGNNYVPVWKRICNSSFHYWSMLLVGIFLARYSFSSSEMSTLTLNVFLIYSFLQQVISIQDILILKEKTRGLLTR